MEWSAHYFTSKESWYPLPENSFKFKDLSFPKPLPPAKLNGEDRLTMREWSSINGAVVRQRSVRQETTMAKAGTLPEAYYHEDLLPADGASHEQIDEHVTKECNNIMQRYTRSHWNMTRTHQMMKKRMVEYSPEPSW